MKYNWLNRSEDEIEGVAELVEELELFQETKGKGIKKSIKIIKRSPFEIAVISTI